MTIIHVSALSPSELQFLGKNVIAAHRQDQRELVSAGRWRPGPAEKATRTPVEKLKHHPHHPLQRKPA